MSTRGVGEALEALRLSRGLTQTGLAKSAGVSQSVLSKLESNLLDLDDERAAALASALRVPVSFFYQAPKVTGSRIFHRKLASLPISVDKRIRAETAVVQAQISALLNRELPTLRLPREPVPIDRYVTPADIADKVRQEWAVPDGPVSNLVEAVEQAGILVLRMNLQSMKLDAIATWPIAGLPVVVLGDHAPGDRQRFTLAHEIGHAVMHDLPAEDQEREADEFASQFLMPEDAIRSELRDTSVSALAKLKLKWGVSLAALARRARDLGEMSEADYRSFNIHMSSTGMNRHEPVEIPPERPRLLASLIEARLSRGERLEDLAAAAFMTPDEFRARFQEAAA